MNTAGPAPWRAERALATALPLACWMTYAPLGLKYTGWLLSLLLAVIVLHQRGGWAERRRQWCRQPAAVLLVAMLGLLLASALWSPAAWTTLVTHAWLYALPLGVLPLGAAIPAPLAWRALVHFVAASAAVGLAVLLHSQGLLPASLLWHSTVDASGNQRIVTSLLLALGAALGLWMASRPVPARDRALLALAALTAASALTLQDRRTGMLMLPALLLVWALAVPRHLAWKAAGVALVALAAVLVFRTSDTVRARFAEGGAEIQAYRSNDEASTSWGQRLRMFERTAEMVRERPLTGHGLGSWQSLWDARVAQGTVLAANSTPHNEYLLVAAQAGVGAAVLMAAWLVSSVAAAWRAGPRGVPGAMVWLALALTGLFNAVLRDAKFSLPLLLLAALALALTQADRVRDGHHPDHEDRSNPPGANAP